MRTFENIGAKAEKSNQGESEILILDDPPNGFAEINTKENRPTYPNQNEHLKENLTPKNLPDDEDIESHAS